MRLRLKYEFPTLEFDMQDGMTPKEKRADIKEANRRDDIECKPPRSQLPQS
jgi:hypothetical protein